jgi:phosphoribosylamine--glycine ligase
MKLLVIGGGGREHAIVWKLAQSPMVEKVYVAPGNAGTARESKVQNIPFASINALSEFAVLEGIDFTVVGPEAPLADGIVDLFQKRGLKIFGPTKAAAQLESSKDFAKRFMARHHIPTAPYESFTSVAMAHLHINERSLPMVIKADGLAAGKGVFVCKTLVEAHEAIDQIAALGDAGRIIIVEDFIPGEEASFIVMVDGTYVVALETSQDHKQLLDGDAGPMTGGMGAISPAPIVTPVLFDRIIREIIMPAVSGMVEENTPYVGFLYAGLMIDARGNPNVLEFNCRLGDPETQVILMRLRSDLCELIEHGVAGTLYQAPDPEWDDRAAVGVVLAAEGYPFNPRKGNRIYGLHNAPGRKIFHAGTAWIGAGRMTVTNGGRVVCVTALGDGIREARENTYQGVEEVYFSGMQYRRDIGHRAIKKAETDKTI